MVMLCGVMLYLGGIAYVVILHLVYLLTSIELFELIQKKYVEAVKTNLKEFMKKISAMLVKSSFFLYDLMEILILHFCVAINYIFFLIKAKLMYYLKLVELQIYADYAFLAIDVAEFKLLLLQLQSLVTKYIKILVEVKVLLSTLNKFLSPIIGNFSSIFLGFNKIVKILLCKFNCITSICNKVNGISSTDGNGCKSPEHIIVRTRNISNHQLKVSITNINHSDINDFHKGVGYIKKIVKIQYRFVSEEIISILGQLLMSETINLPKLFALITQIQNLYLKILVRGYVLKCTIEFFQEIRQTINSLIKLMEFKCSKPSEFLGKCSQVEKYIGTVSKSINECIKKLATVSNKCNINRIKELKEILIKLIGVISFLKFYVDLMAMEILIFKMIIFNIV